MTGKRALEIEEEPSPLGIAREYMLLLGDAKLDPKDKTKRKKAMKLARKIAEMLELPATTARADQILEVES